MLELRIRFSVRMDPENGSESELDREEVLDAVSSKLGFGWDVDKEDINGGSEGRGKVLNLLSSCFSCSGGD